MTGRGGGPWRAVLCAVLLSAALASCAGPRVGPPQAYKTSTVVTVKRGDSLYAIARRHGVPVRALIGANGLRPPYRLYVGQRLRIPTVSVHVVRRGDTIYGISRRYGVDAREVVRLNSIQPPYRIIVGQRLRLPAPARRRGTEVARAEPRQRTRTSPGARPSLALPAPPPRAGRGFDWPVRGKIISRYGSKGGGLHNDGINIAVPRGTPVRAADNGVVAYADDGLKGFGKLLLIKHQGRWVTAYAHNEALLVARGDKVRRGQMIARAGSTGSVAYPQVHFEIRRGAKAVDPLAHLTPRKTARVSR